MGIGAGAAAGVAVVLIHTVLLNRIGYDGPLATLHVGAAANIAILLIGILMGHLHNVRERLRQEIARRAAIEAELGEVQIRFRQIVDTIHEVFWIITADRKRMIYVSPAFPSVFGIPKEKIMNDPRALLDVVDPADRKAVVETLESAPENDYQIEYRINRPDGATRWIHSRAFVVRGEDGTVKRVTGVSSDVTDAKIAGPARQASEEKYYTSTENGDVRRLREEADITRDGNSEAAFARGVITNTARRRHTETMRRGRNNVLVTENEPTVQRLIRDVLETKGHEVLIAKDGEAALEVAARHNGKIDLLITDVVMPQMNGRELAAELRSKYPPLKVLFISGYIGKASVKIAELGPGISFLSKPFSSGTLARKIRLLMDTPAPRPAAPEPSHGGLTRQPM